jgi:hypothetical protein
LQAIEELGINLHFLEIGNIVRMLLGQPFDVISYELPRFELPFGYEMKFPVWTPPPISVEVGLHAEVFADLSVGYDSHGLDTGNFFDGFYFGDRENVFTGDDIDEFGVGVGVSLAALLDLVVASAGVEGQIRADIFANWRDQDDDGKMHLDELVQILETDGIGCVFDLRGELRALVSSVWEVFGADGSYTFIDALLFSFKNECPTFQLGHVAGAGEALPDGSTTAAGTLVLHAGAFAGKRGPGSSSDVAEGVRYRGARAAKPLRRSLQHLLRRRQGRRRTVPGRRDRARDGLRRRRQGHPARRLGGRLPGRRRRQRRAVRLCGRRHAGWRRRRRPDRRRHRR